MRRNWLALCGTVMALGLVGLLAGQASRPPEAFNFDEFERERQASLPLAERARRVEAAPPAQPAAPGTVKGLESTIQDSVTSYGLAAGSQKR